MNGLCWISKLFSCLFKLFKQKQVDMICPQPVKGKHSSSEKYKRKTTLRCFCSFDPIPSVWGSTSLRGHELAVKKHAQDSHLRNSVLSVRFQPWHRTNLQPCVGDQKFAEAPRPPESPLCERSCSLCHKGDPQTITAKSRNQQRFETWGNIYDLAKNSTNQTWL